VHYYAELRFAALAIPLTHTHFFIAWSICLAGCRLSLSFHCFNPLTYSAVGCRRDVLYKRIGLPILMMVTFFYSMSILCTSTWPAIRKKEEEIKRSLSPDGATRSEIFQPVGL